MSLWLISYFILPTMFWNESSLNNEVNVPGSASMTLNRANIQNDAYIFEVFYRLPLTSALVFRVLLVNNMYIYMYIMFPYLAVPYMVIVPRFEILFIIIV